MTDFITEAIEVHGEDLLLYLAVVAEAYEDAPRFDPRTVDGYVALVQSNNRLKDIVLKDVEVEYTPDDPYRTHKEMVQDIVQNHRLRIYTGADEEHPTMSNDENVDLRTIHDYFAHAGPVRKNIAQGKPIRTHGFSARGEISAYLVHAKLAPPEAVPVLFTEVVGQIAYFTITGGYAPQKAAILDGFDYYKIGRFTNTERKSRFNELKEQWNTEDKIAVRVKGTTVITRENAPWKMLSRKASSKPK